MDPIKNTDWLSSAVGQILYSLCQKALGNFDIIDPDTYEKDVRDAQHMVLKYAPMYNDIQKTSFTMRREAGLLPTNCSTEKSPYALTPGADNEKYILQIIEVNEETERAKVVDSYIKEQNAGSGNAARPSNSGRKKSR